MTSMVTTFVTNIEHMTIRKITLRHMTARETFPHSNSEDESIDETALEGSQARRRLILMREMWL
jgi:hypothetical protein